MHRVHSRVPEGAEFVPFTAQTRMSGIDLADGKQVRKGAADAVIKYRRRSKAARFRPTCNDQVDAVAKKGATPLLVCEGNRIAGMVVLEDILKPGIRDRFERLRGHGAADRDGHGRQSADGRHDRRASRRR